MVSPLPALRHSLQWIDLDVHLARVVPQRVVLRAADAGGPDQSLIKLENISALNRIRLMMDARAMKLVSAVARVQNVSLDEEMIDGARTGMRGNAFHRHVSDPAVCRPGAVGIVTLRIKADRRKRIGGDGELDVRVKVRQLVCRARR